MGARGILLLLSILIVAVHGKKDCCKLSGNGNYHQFDKGPMVHFRSNCTYNFASDIGGAFQVWVDTEFHHDNPAVSFAYATIIHYAGKTYVLTVDDVIMPGAAPTPISSFPTYDDGTIEIKHVGGNIRFTIRPEDLELFWHGHKNLEVCLDDRWSQNPYTMDGLCGNFNGNKHDDLVTSDGITVSNDFDGYDIFGESWAEDWQDETDCHAPPATTPSTGTTGSPVSTTTTPWNPNPRCCYARGDPHYDQSDRGRRVNFQGVCTYNLQSAIDGTFQVWVENEHRRGRTHVSWTKLVIVHYAGAEYILGKRNVFVNGVAYPITNPFNTINDGDVVIERIGRNIILTITTENVVVTWNRRSYVRVCMGPEWNDPNGIVNGICGNNNGNPHDDLVTSGGIPVPANRQGWKEFGDSWNVTDCDPEDLVEEDCDMDALLEAAEERRCGQIIDVSGPYASCLADIEPQDFYMGCEFDVCSLFGDDEAILDAVCEHLQALQDICEELGHQVGDWWTAAGCAGNRRICSVVLDPHGDTPDGFEFRVTDVCTYDLAFYDVNLNVAMETYRRNVIDIRRGVSFVKRIIINLNGEEYSMYPTVFKKDNNALMNDANFNCNNGMYKFCCESKTKPFKVCSDRKFSFYLHFEYLFYNAIAGLCGNFNGDASDDYVLRNGGQPNSMAHFVGSWERPNCQ